MFTPRFAEGLSWSVDYFDIKVEDLIGSVGADLILNNCLSGDHAVCALVHRAPGSGTLWLTHRIGFIDDPIINTGSLQVKGIDTEVNYGFDMGGNAGRLAFQLIGTYNDEYKVRAADGRLAEVRLRRPVRSRLRCSDSGVATQVPGHVGLHRGTSTSH